MFAALAPELEGKKVAWRSVDVEFLETSPSSAPGEKRG
jgi:hypothetical protein